MFYPLKRQPVGSAFINLFICLRISKLILLNSCNARKKKKNVLAVIAENREKYLGPAPRYLV
jgi:hypothetical protein